MDIEQVLDDHEDKIQEIIEEDIIRYGWDYEQTRAFQEAVKNRIEGQVSQMMERAFKAPLTAEEQQRELYEKLKAKFEGDE